MLAPSENLDCWKKALTFLGWIREFFSRFTSISIVDSPFGSAVFILVQFVSWQIPYSYCSNLISTSLKWEPDKLRNQLLKEVLPHLKGASYLTLQMVLCAASQYPDILEIIVIVDITSMEKFDAGDISYPV